MKNDDDVNTKHADGDDEEYLSLLEQTAKRTGFKSFDTQTKNLLCDIGVIPLLESKSALCRRKPERNWRKPLNL